MTLNFLYLPTEILDNIFSFCDIESLGRLCRTCRYVHECIESGSVWREKWDAVSGHGDLEISTDRMTQLDYKSMIRRYMTIQEHAITTTTTNSNMSLGPHTVYPLDVPDVLSLEFGSKTSWLKRSRGSWSCTENIRTPIRPKPARCKPSSGQAVRQKSRLANVNWKSRYNHCDDMDPVLETGYTAELPDCKFIRQENESDSENNADVSEGKRAADDTNRDTNQNQLGQGDDCDKKQSATIAKNPHHVFGSSLETVNLEPDLSQENVSCTKCQTLSCRTGHMEGRTHDFTKYDFDQKHHGKRSSLGSDGGPLEREELLRDDQDSRLSPSPIPPVERLSDGLWLSDEYLPEGPLLCTCIMCYPRIRLLARRDTGLLPVPDPALCMHHYQNGCYQRETLVTDTHNNIGQPGLGVESQRDVSSIAGFCGTKNISESSSVGKNTQNEICIESNTYEVGKSLEAIGNKQTSCLSSNETDCKGCLHTRLGDELVVLEGGSRRDLLLSEVSDHIGVIRRLVTLSGMQICYYQTTCQISEPKGWSRNGLSQLVRLLFEALGIQSMCFVPKAVNVAMALGIETCLVVDTGAHSTLVSAVVGQKLLEGTERFRGVGGVHISQTLAEVLHHKGINSYVCACELDGRDIKSYCYLKLHPRAVRCSVPKEQHLSIRSLRHRSGWCSVTLSEELYLAPELMYCSLNLPCMIKQTIAPLPAILQKRLLSNIILTGGNSALTGMSSRLQLDLQRTLPNLAPWTWVRSRSLNLNTGSEGVEGLSYVGLPAPSGGDDVYVTREDYIRQGAKWCLQKLQLPWRVSVQEALQQTADR